MTPSINCYNLIKKFEGLFLKAYPDPKTNGKPYTIGYGSTMYMDGKPIMPSDTITQDMADKLLQWEVNNKAAALGTFKCNQNQFDALVSFVFNLGIGNWNKSTLKKKVLLNPNDESIRAEFMKWVSPGTNVEKGLTRRRKAEADLYFS